MFGNSGVWWVISSLLFFAFWAGFSRVIPKISRGRVAGNMLMRESVPLTDYEADKTLDETVSTWRDWARASKFKANQSPGALAGQSGAGWANSMWRDTHHCPVDLCPVPPQKKKPKYK